MMEKGQSQLQQAFIRWQCRLRQMIVREGAGKPDGSIRPLLILSKDTEPLGHIITLMNKKEEYSYIPEMMQIAKHTYDPQIRQEKALKLLCEYYYTRANEFSDILTASFIKPSKNTKKIVKAGEVKLQFKAFGQEFELYCQVEKLSKQHYYYKATWWHNHLFNPLLSKDVTIISFIPNWKKSISSPLVAA